MAKNTIRVKGIVKRSFSTSEFEVELENKVLIKAVVSGKIRVFHIQILPGDKVEVELSPYDMTRGRITYRY